MYSRHAAPSVSCDTKNKQSSNEHCCNPRLRNGTYESGCEKSVSLGSGMNAIPVKMAFRAVAIIDEQGDRCVLCIGKSKVRWILKDIIEERKGIELKDVRCGKA